MTKIRIDTEHAREVARRLIAESERMAEMGRELGGAISGLNTGAWDGHSRYRAEPMLNQVQPENQRVAEDLDALGHKLLHVAETFEHEDTTAARNLSGMPWVDFETAGGQVLGVATVAGAASTVMLASMDVPSEEYRLRDISNMSWSERLRYAKLLPEQIQSLAADKKRLQNQILQDGQELEDIDRQLQALRAERTRLQEEADDWRNKIKPDDDGLRWGFDDGILDAPWRTEADDLEDQIDDLDQQIIGLQDQRQKLMERRHQYEQGLDTVGQQLDSKQHDLDEVNRVLEKGISKDGPSDYYAYFPDNNCTKYAASKRDVPCRGHAYKWNNEAKDSGYEVGKRPISGSVMVWEREFKWADPDYGHVAVVENVAVQDDGSYKVWYTDNNTEGNSPASIVLDPDMQNVSFIYEKLPTS